MWCENYPKAIWKLIEAIHRSRFQWEFNGSGQAKQLFANSRFWLPSPGSCSPPSRVADEHLIWDAHWELCHSLSTSDPPRARQMMNERPWETDAGVSGGQQAEADANMARECVGIPVEVSRLKLVLMQTCPFLSYYRRRRLSLNLPANTDPKSPETYIAGPVGAASDASAVLGDRIALSGVDNQSSMLAGALYTGASRKCRYKIMKVAPVGQFAKQSKLSHDLIVADRGFRILLHGLSTKRKGNHGPKPEDDVRADLLKLCENSESIIGRGLEWTAKAQKKISYQRWRQQEQTDGGGLILEWWHRED
jgi:hypothetical protein